MTDDWIEELEAADDLDELEAVARRIGNYNRDNGTVTDNNVWDTAHRCFEELVEVRRMDIIGYL